MTRAVLGAANGGRKPVPRLSTSVSGEVDVISRTEAARILWRSRRSSSKPLFQATGADRVYRAQVGHALGWFTLVVPNTRP